MTFFYFFEKSDPDFRNPRAANRPCRNHPRIRSRRRLVFSGRKSGSSRRKKRQKPSHCFISLSIRFSVLSKNDKMRKFTRAKCGLYGLLSIYRLFALKTEPSLIFPPVSQAIAHFSLSPYFLGAKISFIQRQIVLKDGVFITRAYLLSVPETTPEKVSHLCNPTF